MGADHGLPGGGPGDDAGRSPAWLVLGDRGRAVEVEGQGLSGCEGARRHPAVEAAGRHPGEQVGAIRTGEGMDEGGGRVKAQAALAWQPGHGVGRRGRHGAGLAEERQREVVDALAGAVEVEAAGPEPWLAHRNLVAGLGGTQGDDAARDGDSVAAVGIGGGARPTGHDHLSAFHWGSGAVPDDAVQQHLDGATPHRPQVSPDLAGGAVREHDGLGRRGDVPVLVEGDHVPAGLHVGEGEVALGVGLGAATRAGQHHGHALEDLAEVGVLSGPGNRARERLQADSCDGRRLTGLDDHVGARRRPRSRAAEEQAVGPHRDVRQLEVPLPVGIGVEVRLVLGPHPDVGQGQAGDRVMHGAGDGAAPDLEVEGLGRAARARGRSRASVRQYEGWLTVRWTRPQVTFGRV